MRLFGIPNGVIDRRDRAEWLSMPFDLSWLPVIIIAGPYRIVAGELFTAGAVAAQLFASGGRTADGFSAGGAAGDLHAAGGRSGETFTAGGVAGQGS